VVFEWPGSLVDCFYPSAATSPIDAVTEGPGGLLISALHPPSYLRPPSRRQAWGLAGWQRKVTEPALTADPAGSGDR
jgi:hypothetical protein